MGFWSKKEKPGAEPEKKEPVKDPRSEVKAALATKLGMDREDITVGAFKAKPGKVEGDIVYKIDLVDKKISAADVIEKTGLPKDAATKGQITAENKQRSLTFRTSEEILAKIIPDAKDMEDKELTVEIRKKPGFANAEVTVMMMGDDADKVRITNADVSASREILLGEKNKAEKEKITREGVYDTTVVVAFGMLNAALGVTATLPEGPAKKA